MTQRGWPVAFGGIGLFVALALLLLLISDPASSATPLQAASAGPVGTGWAGPPPRTTTAGEYCRPAPAPAASMTIVSGGVVYFPPTTTFKAKVTSVASTNGYPEGRATLTDNAGRTITVGLNATGVAVALSAHERNVAVEVTTRADLSTCSGVVLIEQIKI